jgi:hypothetical protein
MFATEYTLDEERASGLNYLLSMGPLAIVIMLAIIKFSYDLGRNEDMANKTSQVMVYLFCNLELILVVLNFLAAFFHVRIFDYLLIVAVLHMI